LANEILHTLLKMGEALEDTL